MRLAIAMLAVAACNTPPPATPGVTPDAAQDAAPETMAPDPPIVSGPSDGARSGGRLKLTYWRTEDGIAVWRPVFFDSQLGISCVPVRWRDGGTYCTPFDEQTLRWTTGLGASDNFILIYPPQAIVPAFYTDEACTVPVGPPDATTAGYVVEYDVPLHTPPASRHEVQHLYRRGAARGTVAAYEKASEFGGCVLFAQQAEVFDLIEIPSSSFAAMRTLVDPVGGDGFAMSYVVSDDGLQLPLGLYASAFDDVVAMSFKAGALWATGTPASPSTAPFGAFFAEMSCTVPVAAVAATAIRPATTFMGSEIRQLSVQATATVFRFDTECHEVAASDDFVYYVLGSSPVSAPTFVRRIDTLAGRRMQYIRDVAPAGLATRETLLYDADNQYECSLHGLDSGPLDAGGDFLTCQELTCGHLERVFTDEACTSGMTVYVHDRSSGFHDCDDVPVPARVTGYPITSTPVLGRFYRKQLIGPGPPGTVICEPRDFTSRAFETGPQVALKPSPQFRPVVDP
jgi:hypothetical protein